MPLSSPQAPELVAPTGTVNADALNLRSGPSPLYHGNAVTYEGQSLTILARNANTIWLKVRHRPTQGTSLTGWAGAGWVATNFPLSALPGEGSPTLQNATVITAGLLNVRYGPSVLFAVFDRLTQGQSVTLLGRHAAGSWSLSGCRQASRGG
ncbi:MAG: hypothetical protein R3300_17105 [Candidatus Promineifilaceae bacterium]|nr:hypothetical protein [Candidatus Promineifilaceae bacterium]